MGGKNPTIVSATRRSGSRRAGVARSAFGLSGQKCSACSRVYVERDVYDDFVARARRARAGSLAVGDPTDRDAFLGPVIDAEAVERFERRGRARAKERPGRHRGRGAGASATAAPTGTTSRRPWSPTCRSTTTCSRDELFVPLVAVAPVDSLDEALDLANDTELGLTAGFFSADDAEVEEFLDRIEAGVVYVNRPAGATTGAWPGVQPFGGWKGSGIAARPAAVSYYVQQFMREQSRTVVLVSVTAPSWLDAGRPVPDVRTALPGPAGQAVIDATPRSPAGRCRAPTRWCRAARYGSVVEDADGNLFLDFNAGIAVTSTGHCHPDVVEAVIAQATELLHYSASDFYLPIYSRMCDALGGDRADRRAGPGLPHQLRRRGGRGRDEARPVRDRAGRT